MSLERAEQLFRDGSIDEAAACCRAALAQDPQRPDAWHFLGQIQQRAGAHPAALECFGNALKIAPDAVPAIIARGRSLRAMGRAEEAAAAFRNGLHLRPDSAEAASELGNLLKGLGRVAEALPLMEEAARLSPGEAAYWLNLGAALLDVQRPAEARPAVERGLALEPDRPEALNLLGSVLMACACMEEARAAFAKALQMRPGFPAAHDNLGRLCKACGAPDTALVHFRAALAGGAGASTHSNLLLALQGVETPPEAMLAEHRAWEKTHASSWVGQPRPQLQSLEGRRIRVGYVSPDLCSHAVAFFLESVLESHDRSRFEVFAYSDVAVPDSTSSRLRALCEHWRDIAGSSDAAVEAKIRADRIDLLVDLAGHTAGNRLPLFARRPAPVQATWIGYPCTTGLQAMGYRITDAVSDPTGVSDPWHSEALVRLPGPFSCYRPPVQSPLVNALPALSGGCFTFGCFNNAAKVTAPVVALWARLLCALPDARLWMRSGIFADPAIVTQWREGFAIHGVGAGRLKLDGSRLPVREHLEAYGRVDVALDPFPYNGTTTTCEALWMGVPVVTLAGRTHVARVGASLLTHLGAPEWIASSPDAYVACAATLASDLPALARIRGVLRERMAASPLCDAIGFTRGLEAAFGALLAVHVE